MTYDGITEDGRLWAVKYDDSPDNALYMLRGLESMLSN